MSLDCKYVGITTAMAIIVEVNIVKKNISHADIMSATTTFY